MAAELTSLMRGKRYQFPAIQDVRTNVVVNDIFGHWPIGLDLPRHYLVTWLRLDWLVSLHSHSGPFIAPGCCHKFYFVLLRPSLLLQAQVKVSKRLFPILLRH